MTKEGYYNLLFIGIKHGFYEGEHKYHHDRLLLGVGWSCNSILLLVANGHHNCIKSTKADIRLRTSDDGQKGCPKHVE